MYIKRAFENQIKQGLSHYPIIMVTGPRQVGKSTMLKHITKDSGFTYVTLDYPQLRTLAKSDPELFLQQYKAPLLIDEIQYAPELLPFIKIRVDKENNNGMYILTGSQMFLTMKNISESLAGRVGIFKLFSFSQNELLERESNPFLPTNQFPLTESTFTIQNVFENILRGSMPRLRTEKELSSESFYNSYIQTYLERDIRDLINIKKEREFIKFLSCIAARTAQELVISEIAKEVEVDSKTIENWISVLESSGIIVLLKPFYNNVLKRIVKHPKIYFMDTGLACHLSMWNNAESLSVSAMAGAMFETYVVSEIIKSYVNSGKEYSNRLFYYRDTDQKEIDLLIVENNTIYPIEIKKSAAPDKSMLKNFMVLEKTSLTRGDGAVLCMTPFVLPLTQNDKAVPIAWI